MKQMIEMVREKLDRVIANADHPTVNMKYKIQVGNPFHNIIDEITEEQADLLIVGTEGAEGLNEFFVGSNAEKIVRRGTCPVITLRGKSALSPIEKMLFASDFMRVDDLLAERVKKLQSVLAAQLNIVKINTPASFTSTRHDTQQMQEFISKYRIEHYTLAVYNHKNEEDGIILYAEDVEAGMIALGTHQRKGLGHLLSGSIAEDVVNHSPIPLWTSHLNA